MLKQIFKKAIKAGGAEMSSTAAKRIFGEDARLRRNVLLACSTPFLANAILSEVICDHRVIEFLMKTGPLAARIILQVEGKLDRKLQRSRIEQLVKLYLARNGQAQKTEGSRAAQKTKAMVSSVIQRVSMATQTDLKEVSVGMPIVNHWLRNGSEFARHPLH